MVRCFSKRRSKLNTRWPQFINHANCEIIDSNVMKCANVTKIPSPPSAKRPSLPPPEEIKKGKVCYKPRRPIRPALISGFCSMKRLGVFLLPPGWHAGPSQGYPSIRFAGTHLYTWVERGTVRVKCLSQEHN